MPGFGDPEHGVGGEGPGCERGDGNDAAVGDRAAKERLVQVELVADGGVDPVAGDH